jgi:hypothetical protein
MSKMRSVDLVINLKSATTIGLDTPAHLQQLADESSNNLLCRICSRPVMALFGHGAMSDLSSLCVQKRRLNNLNAARRRRDP